MKLQEKCPKDVESVSFQAGKEAIKRTKNALNNKELFAVETTLSSNQSIKTIQEAKEKGFEIKLYYVGLQRYTVNFYAQE